MNSTVGFALLLSTLAGLSTTLGSLLTTLAGLSTTLGSLLSISIHQPGPALHDAHAGLLRRGDDPGLLR